MQIEPQIKQQINKMYMCPQKRILTLPLQIFAILELR